MKPGIFNVILLTIILVVFYSCKPDNATLKTCQIDSVHDDGGTFTNNNMTFEYGSDEKISRIDGSDFSYEFKFHDDSVTISEYDQFQYLICTRQAWLNNLGLISWERDTFYLVHSVDVSTFSYDNNGSLLHYLRQGMDTFTYDFQYSNGNAISATLKFNGTSDTIFYSFEYLNNTNNKLLILPVDADDIMLSGLYGKTSTNLLKNFTQSSSYGDFGENYEYELDGLGNATKRFELFMGDTLGMTTFEWNCK